MSRTACGAAAAAAALTRVPPAAGRCASGVLRCVPRARRRDPVRHVHGGGGGGGSGGGGGGRDVGGGGGGGDSTSTGGGVLVDGEFNDVFDVFRGGAGDVAALCETARAQLDRLSGRGLANMLAALALARHFHRPLFEVGQGAACSECFSRHRW